MPRLARAVLSAPTMWLLAFVLVPLLVTARISLSESASASPPYRPVWPGTLDPRAWLDFAGALGLDAYRTLLSDDLYGEAALRSGLMAAGATLLIAILAYPVALALARAPSRWKPALLLAVVLPFWTSFLVRVYAWIAILRDDGWLNAGLLRLGLVREPLAILNTDWAVAIGLVYAYCPFMILPLYASLDALPPEIEEAAADLGASRRVAFWTVVLPLSRPGLVAGSLLCFMPILGEFVIPDLLGGSDTLMLGRTLWTEFFSNRDWPLASAAAIVMLAALVLPYLLARRVEAARLGDRA